MKGNGPTGRKNILNELLENLSQKHGGYHNLSKSASLKEQSYEKNEKVASMERE